MRFWHNPNFLAILALVILSIPALKSLATPGFYTSHDGETHTARTAAYYQALTDKQFPPRFAGNFYNGLGSPIFTYIYPIPYLTGSAMHLLGFSFADSFKIIMVFGYILSAIFAYLWLKELTDSPKAAFLGALYYIWAPYRFLLVYVRASLSEDLAYTFLPLVLFALTKLVKRQNLRWVAICAIFIALLLLSQNLVALISIPILGSYLFILALLNKSIRYVFLGLVAAIWGMAISSITYLSSLFERDFTHYNEIFKSTYDTHFVTIKQLIRSPWDYGFDMPGTVNDQMSFQIGLAHLLILIFVLIIFTYWFFHRIGLFKKVGDYLFEKSDITLSIFSIFFLVVFAVSIFLMIDVKPNVLIWQNFKTIRLIDIPWRFLGLTILAVSFLAAYVAKTIKPAFIFILLVFAVLVANRNHLRINKIQDFDDSFFQTYTGHATQYSEFTPIWRQTIRIPIDFDPKIRAEVINGEAQIENLYANSKKIMLEVNVQSENAQIRINKFYFPGVQATLNNRKLTPFKDLIITNPKNIHLEKEQDSSGLMLVNLDKGNHQITAEFSETHLRLFADYLSLGSLIFAIGFVVKGAKK